MRLVACYLSTVQWSEFPQMLLQSTSEIDIWCVAALKKQSHMSQKRGQPVEKVQKI